MVMSAVGIVVVCDESCNRCVEGSFVIKMVSKIYVDCWGVRVSVIVSFDISTTFVCNGLCQQIVA